MQLGQITREINQLLHVLSSQPMVTYKVVPINSNFGLIEFVKNTEKMENLIKNNPDINKEIFKVPFGVLNQNDLLQCSWEQRLRDHQVLKLISIYFDKIEYYYHLFLFFS